jgi:hypothetical protein
MKSLEAAKLFYASASDHLAFARRNRNNFTSNFERDIRHSDMVVAEAQVCNALDKLWAAQKASKL